MRFCTGRFHSFVLQVLFCAIRAQAGKLKIVTDDFIHRCGVELIFNLIQGGNGGILHPVALDATDMVVFAANPVIPFQGSAEFELLDFTQLRQHFQVAVDCTQADSGQVPANPLIQFICTGVVVMAPQLFKKNHPLPGGSEGFILGLVLNHGFDRLRGFLLLAIARTKNSSRGQWLTGRPIRLLRSRRWSRFRFLLFATWRGCGHGQLVSGWRSLFPATNR